MEPTAAAYVAGLMDGEGSIMLYMRRDTVAMRITISNTSKPLLQWVMAKAGIGSIVTHAPRDERCKQSYWWQANAEAAEHVLQQLLPYMVLKTNQAKLALETQNRLRDPVLKADRSWQVPYAERMRAMNKRGPVAS